MSKNTATKPLTDNTRKLIIIIAIVLVAVIILSVALALILKTDEKKPADNNTDNSNSSTLPIKNGDFLYTSSDDTGYPRTAVNWTKYGYKLETISSSDKSVMGIIDLDEKNWNEVKNDLAAEGIDNVTNPGRHSDELEDSNVYLIANKESNAASILSDSTSVASGASIKVTVWLNVSMVTEGNAVIMIQKSTVSTDEDNWYAYDFKIVENGDTNENGWQKHEFFIFNREASTKYIRVSVGLGNVYQEGEADEGIGATGILLVDDIMYETVTANDYRKEVDSEEADYQRYKIIENEDITDESKYFELQAGTSTTTIIGQYGSVADFQKDEVEGDAELYLPFTNRDDFKDGTTGFTIYKIAQNGGKDITALRLVQNIQLAYSQVDKDHFHISFWLRVAKKDGHAATKANVYVQKQNAAGEWEDLNSGSFTEITTNQDVKEDANCGWVKYDIYLKPSSTTTVENPDLLSIYFVLGVQEGYSEKDLADGLAPRGSLYVTSPAYEQISYKDYNNASSGGNVKKINLIGDSSSTTVANGSFSDVNNIGDEPTSWTPVFAGDNAIYKDGLGNDLDKLEDKTLRNKTRVAGSGINKSGSAVDDAQKNILQITTDGANFGYISNDINLSSRTVYVFSVVVKTTAAGQTPFIYLVDNSKETRADAIVARVESANADEQKELDKYFDFSHSELVDNTNGWARYYLVFVTGNEASSVRIALFNGAIDAVDGSNLASGTIYYDNVKMKAIGTYSFVDDDDKEATHYLVEFSANSGYDDAIDVLTGEDHNAIVDGNEIVTTLGGEGKGFTQPSAEEWDEMTLIPEDSDNADDDHDHDHNHEQSSVDWGLLMSVISSVLLVATLLIVFVIKFFQRKRHTA